jgi:hypothetical protein
MDDDINAKIRLLRYDERMFMLKACIVATILFFISFLFFMSCIGGHGIPNSTRKGILFLLSIIIMPTSFTAIIVSIGELRSIERSIERIDTEKARTDR